MMDDDDVKFNSIAGEVRLCGTQLTLQRAAIIRVIAKLYVNMVIKSGNTRRIFL